MLLALAFSAAVIASAPASDAVCKGAAPTPGAMVEGTVLHVGDGSHLCLATSANPADWTELRMNTVYVHDTADADPEYGRAALMSVAFGQKLSCKIGKTGAADCRDRAGRRIAERLAEPGAAVRAAQWYKPAAKPDLAVLRIAAR